MIEPLNLSLLLEWLYLRDNVWNWRNLYMNKNTVNKDKNHILVTNNNHAPNCCVDVLKYNAIGMLTIIINIIDLNVIIFNFDKLYAVSLKI